jgi:hypothetical protein
MCIYCQQQQLRLQAGQARLLAAAQHMRQLQGNLKDLSDAYLQPVIQYSLI